MSNIVELTAKLQIAREQYVEAQSLFVQNANVDNKKLADEYKMRYEKMLETWKAYRK
jgi:hypothetical protein